MPAYYMEKLRMLRAQCGLEPNTATANQKIEPEPSPPRDTTPHVCMTCDDISLACQILLNLFPFFSSIFAILLFKGC